MTKELTKEQISVDDCIALVMADDFCGDSFWYMDSGPATATCTCYTNEGARTNFMTLSTIVLKGVS